MHRSHREGLGADADPHPRTRLDGGTQRAGGQDDEDLASPVVRERGPHAVFPGRMHGHERQRVRIRLPQGRAVVPTIS